MHKKMKYSCVILDHDDTVVNSTVTIHYPAFCEYMKTVRPGIRLTSDEYFAYNFEPGVIPLFRDICGLSEREMKEEEAYWNEYVKTRIPEAYPGLKEVLERYREAGGKICVVSHSFSHYILRDYRENGLPEPDAVFGWDLTPENRKPAPYAVYEIEKMFSLKPEEILVLDDLKPGYEMARAAGTAFAAAGWANDVPEIREFMMQNSDYYCRTVSEFGKLLLGEEEN